MRRTWQCQTLRGTVSIRDLTLPFQLSLSDSCGRSGSPFRTTSLAMVADSRCRHSGLKARDLLWISLFRSRQH